MTLSMHSLYARLDNVQKKTAEPWCDSTVSLCIFFWISLTAESMKSLFDAGCRLFQEQLDDRHGDVGFFHRQMDRQHVGLGGFDVLLPGEHRFHTQLGRIVQ